MLLKLLLGWSIVWLLRTRLCGNNRQSPQHSGLIHEPTGKITGSFFHINYETSWANEIIASWFNPTVRWKRELLEVWFSGGVLLMGIGQCMSLILFTYILYKSLVTLAMKHDVLSDDFSEPVEHPLIMPGSDVEPGQLFLFWLCTLLVLLVHEVGHAAAASMERLYIQGFGIFFVLMFPGAYVRVENSIQYLPTRAQLRIYSAGVWHNFCFALLMFVAIELGPLILSYSPFERLSVGLTVLEVQSYSPLSRALPVGSVITRLNGVSLHSVGTFENIAMGYSQLLKSSFEVSPLQLETFKSFLGLPDLNAQPGLVMGGGFCRQLDPLQMRFDERHADLTAMNYDPLDCCKDLLSGQGSDADGYCFSANVNSHSHTHNSADGSVQRSNYSHIHSHTPFSGLVCLSPRDVISHSEANLMHYSQGRDAGSFGVVDADALEEETKSQEGVVNALKSNNADFCLSDADCGSDTHSSCIRPLSSFPFTLMRLDILGRAEPVITEYSPAALISSVKLSSYTLTSPYFNEVISEFPWFRSFALSIPSQCHFFCWLCVQLSVSVGLLNMMPAKYLDGGLAFPQFARLYIPRRWCNWASDVAVGFGSALLVLNILMFAIPMVKPILDSVLFFAL